jgi:hypothetical protein
MKRRILPIRCLIHPHIIISDICDEYREDKINQILDSQKLSRISVLRGKVAKFSTK